MDKAQTLAESEGYDDPLDLLEDVGFDSVQPGICMNDGCDYTTEVEPDQDKGWCEMCDAGTVQSISVLMGVI